jgi:ATP-dependent Clp protease protease subunit
MTSHLSEEFDLSAQPPQAMIIPSVPHESSHGLINLDIYSRALRDRVIELTGTVTDEMASLIAFQLFSCDQDKKNEPITLLINSRGGSVTAGNRIIDTMKNIRSKIRTVGSGLCASMGSAILAAGEPGMRTVHPRALVMIHQPSGESQGQQTMMKISQKLIDYMRNMLERDIARSAGLDYDDRNIRYLFSSAFERDNWLPALMALRLGLVDGIEPPAIMINARGEPSSKEELADLSPEDKAVYRIRRADLEDTIRQQEKYFDSIDLDSLDPSDSHWIAVKKVILERENMINGGKPIRPSFLDWPNLPPEEPKVANQNTPARKFG